MSDQGPAGRRRDWGYGGVTPDSIHVGLDGQTRYLDPGVASAAARQSCWSHEASALAYTAPEQTGADANFDATSDNFSVGVMLWELLTCRPLFGASTAAETLERIHLAPIPRVQRQLFVRRRTDRVCARPGRIPSLAQRSESSLQQLRRVCQRAR